MLWLTIVTQGSGCDLHKVWRDHADGVRGHGIECGHFIPEERPDPVYGGAKGVVQRLTRLRLQARAYSA